MLYNMVFLALLIAGSVYCAARFDLRFEETLPINCMMIVMVLFLCGLCGALKAGVYLVVLLAMALYGLAAICLIRKKQIVKFAKNLLTPGSVVFLVAFFALSMLNHGKLASEWDEFSHWMDVVKVMSSIDDFSTNPASGSIFMAYPPGMALFQYFLQKVVTLVRYDAGFSEWRAYFAYQILVLAVVLPFFKGISFREPGKLLCLSVGLTLIPLIFYSNFYSVVFIDAFLGVLIGVGIAMAVTHRLQDKVHGIYMCLICGMLTLSKDTGLVFALFIAIACVLNALLELRLQPCSGRQMKKLGGPALVLISALLPKFLWDYEVATSKAAVNFSGSVDFGILLDVLLGRDETYRTTVWRNYGAALANNSLTFGSIGIKMSYISMFALVLWGFYLIFRFYKKKDPEKSKAVGGMMIVFAVMTVSYVIGLAVIYMFKFTEYEAVRLASMNRYLGIVLFGGFLAVALITWDRLSTGAERSYQIGWMMAILLIAPLQPIWEFADGTKIAASESFREQYDEIVTTIQTRCEPDSRAFLISQGNNGQNYQVIRFSVRPVVVTGGYWSVGEPFYDGDIWTLECSAEEWMDILVASYDYVVLYDINPYFLEHYTELFAVPGHIRENAVYRVNQETRLLELCP